MPQSSFDFMTIYLAVWLAVLGAALGSFFDCAAWRRAHGESVLSGRSHCGDCGRELKARDLIPVVSYLAAKGRCRYCGARIPADALWAELAGAAAFAALTLRYGLSVRLIMWLIFAALLLLLSLIDHAQRILPDPLLLAAIASRAAFWILAGHTAAELREMLIGAFAVSVPLLVLVLLMDRVLGKESMGGGDVKLVFTAGLYLPWLQMILMVLLACVLGIAGTLWSRRRERGKTGEGFAFGPYLAAAVVLTALCGQPLTDWYVNLLL